MESQLYDDNLLTQYLLGGLSEAQVEELDELSIIDDEVASQLGEVENDLIDAYVRGEMTGQARAQFESRYLTSPRRREKVKFAQSLQAFAETKMRARTTAPAAIIAENPIQEAQPAEPEPVRSSVAESVPWWYALRNVFTVPSLTLQWGFAAAALLMLLVGGWFIFETLGLRGQVDKAETERVALQQKEKELQGQVEQQRSTSAQTAEDLKQVREKLAKLEQQRALEQQQAKVQPPSPPQELSIVHFDLSSSVRGGGNSASLPVPVGTDYLTLQLELEADEYPAYRAELRTQADDQKVWSSGRLKSRARGNDRVIDVTLRADLLQSRGYLVKLVGIAATGAVENVRSYPFKVVTP